MFFKQLKHLAPQLGTKPLVPLINGQRKFYCYGNGEKTINGLYKVSDVSIMVNQR